LYPDYISQQYHTSDHKAEASRQPENMDQRASLSQLLDALARGAAAGATAAERRGAMAAAESLRCLAPANCTSLLADARVGPALAAAICSRHADGAVVQQAMRAAAENFYVCVVFFPTT
jgi:hypothetical protein